MTVLARSFFELYPNKLIDMSYFKLEWNPYHGQFRYSEIGKEGFQYLPKEDFATVIKEDEWEVICEKLAEDILMKFTQNINEKYDLCDVNGNEDPYPSCEIIKAEFQSLF